MRGPHAPDHPTSIGSTCFIRSNGAFHAASPHAAHGLRDRLAARETHA
ncbi:hypothetical protein RGUI_3808 [Rhodovulum sp. P5]|nr:hypothetical protein RGUI_3808 [Rhodovulum sp. P5]